MNTLKDSIINGIKEAAYIRGTDIAVELVDETVLLESPAEKKRFQAWYCLLENNIKDFETASKPLEPHRAKFMELARTMQQSVFSWNVLI